MKYGNANLGQIEAIINKLGGMEGVEKFLSGEMVIRPNFNLSVWMVLEFHRNFADANFYKKEVDVLGLWRGFNVPALEILKKSYFTERRSWCVTKTLLVNVSVAELGFKNGATIKEIYNCAVRSGLKLCLPEVGPELRLKYFQEEFTISSSPLPNDSLRKDFELKIGMDTIDGEIFRLRNLSSTLCLMTSPGNLGEFCEPEERWLFSIDY